MTRLNARQKAWRKVGDAFATPETNDINGYGLCWGLHVIVMGAEYSASTSPFFGEVKHLHRTPKVYWLPFRNSYMYIKSNEQDDTCRALFAYLMAELTDDEYRAIGGIPELFEKGHEK